MKFASSASQCYLQFHIIGAACDDAPVIVTEYNDGAGFEIGAEHLLAGGIETVNISQGKHRSPF